jgi:hypothetical protein
LITPNILRAGEEFTVSLRPSARPKDATMIVSAVGATADLEKYLSNHCGSGWQPLYTLVAPIFPGTEPTYYPYGTGPPRPYLKIPDPVRFKLPPVALATYRITRAYDYTLPDGSQGGFIPAEGTIRVTI